MKRWLQVICLLVASSALGADWTHSLSKAEPGAFPAPRPLRATYQFGWTAIHAADASFTFSRPSASLIKLEVELKTTGAARTLFRLDAHHCATARLQSLRPLKSDQSEVYEDETISTQLAFDQKGVTRRRTSTSPGPGEGKPKRFDFFPLQDFQSTFLWLRSQRLESGDTYRLLVYPSTTPYLAEFKVGGIEKLHLAGQSFPAHRLEVRLQCVSKSLALSPFKKFKRASLWISNDPDRLLLKVEAEVFIGKVWVELQNVEFTR